MPIKLTDLRYLIGILVATTWAIAFPTWVGQSYSISSETNLVEYPSGTFGLDGESSFLESVAPVWSPPHPVSPSIAAPVRMPWQPASHHDHVEISVSLTFFRLFLCGLVLGMLHRINVALRRSTNSTIGSVAWSTALMSIVGCLGMFVIGGFSMGYALTDQVVIAIMVTLTLAGIVLGIWKRPREAATGEVKSNAAGARGLGWTILGLGFGLALLLAMNRVVFYFRPSAGPFVVDHTGNLIVGSTMILIAWSTALALWQRVPAGIRNGFLFTATVLGTFCIFQK